MVLMVMGLVILVVVFLCSGSVLRLLVFVVLMVVCSLWW